MGRFAFDIEMLTQTDGKPDDFSDPENFELLAIGWGYDAGEEIETGVILREGWSVDDELAVLDEFLDVVEDRDVSRVLTYNGERFDYPQIIGRARLGAENGAVQNGIEDRVQRFMDEYEHDDLKHDVWDAFGDYIRLEEAASRVGAAVDEYKWWEYDTGVDPREWRSKGVDVPVVGGRDMDGYGRALLDNYADGMGDSNPQKEIKRLIVDYTEGDIEPLFVLDDARPFVADEDDGQLQLPF